jgi:DNA-binding beta-propeller fold protein YncE
MKRLLFLLVVVFLASSCSPPVRELADGSQRALTPDQARVTVYLETLNKAGSDQSFRLLKVELAGRGEWQMLNLPKARFKRREIESRQLLLGVAPLLADTYSKIRLTLSEVQNNGASLLADKSERRLELILTVPLVLAPQASRCLFIEWHSLASAVAQGDFFSAFTARPQRRPQITNLVTVLCRELATVYQISPDRNRVIAALGVPENSGEIAYDRRRRRFYVVATSARALLKYDAVTNRLLDSMAMPQSVAPKSLVLSADGRYAFISDTPANRIIKIDVATGFIERTTAKRLRPGKLFFFPGKVNDVLAALAPSESAVYLLDPESLKTRFILPVNGRPAGIARIRDYLYISDISSDKVALYSLVNGRLLNLIRVGRAPLDLVAEGGRVYASVSKESYLSLLMPPQVTPVRRIRCRFRPGSLAISRNWQKIYAANLNPPQLEVIDLQAGAGLGIVPLPGSPDQIVLWKSH